MKLIVVFLTGILLATPTSLLVAQGQKTTSRRGQKPRPAAKSSAVTTTPSGLIYIITRRSQGLQPTAGQTVVVNYTGLLGDGVKFDSSLDRGQPFSFKLGMGRVIKGWDEGIAKLRVGEQATLIVPPHLGYGARGAGDVIPPNSTLIFIVELISIQDPQP